eukprot:3289857-Amphidinium_carterae.1
MVWYPSAGLPEANPIEREDHVVHVIYIFRVRLPTVGWTDLDKALKLGTCDSPFLHFPGFRLHSSGTTVMSEGTVFLALKPLVDQSPEVSPCRLPSSDSVVLFCLRIGLHPPILPTGHPKHHLMNIS